MTWKPTANPPGGLYLVTGTRTFGGWKPAQGRNRCSPWVSACSLWRFSKSSRLLIAAATAFSLSAPALAQSQEDAARSFSSSGLWASEIRDYASKSLNNEQGLSVAAVPLNGPGIDQYVNADQLMNPGSIMKLVTTYAALELLGPRS